MRLPRKEFSRGVTFLVGGTVLSHGALVLASPLLTRLYSAGDFGLLAVFSSLLAILSVVSSLRYQVAIPLPECDREAANLLVLSLIVIPVTALSLLVASLLYGERIVSVLNTPQLSNYLWLLAPAMLFVGVYQALSCWTIRKKQFPILARTKVSQSASMIGVQVLGYSLGAASLLIGRVAGQAAGIYVLVRKSVWANRCIFTNVSLEGLCRVAIRYRRFPIYSGWAAVINTVSTALPPILLAAKFSPAIAGLYLLSNQVLALPMAVVGKAVGDVFFSHAATAHREADLKPIVSGVHRNLTRFALAPTFLVVICGPDIFAYCFGEEWRTAGVFSRWLVLWNFMVFVTSPLSTLLEVMEKQAHNLVFQSVMLCLRIAALYMGFYYDSATLGIALFAVASAICLIGLLIWIYKNTGCSLALLGWSTMRTAVFAITLVSPVLFSAYFEVSPVTRFLCLGLSLLMIGVHHSRLLISIRRG